MRSAVFMAALAALAVAGCAAKKDDAKKVSLSFQTQLDSGNALYRRGDFKGANEYYHLAAKSDPTNISGFYGIYMAESKLGNAEEAAKAKEMVAKMAPEMPLSAHPTAATSGGDPHAGMPGAAPGAKNAPLNQHIPHAGETKPELPIDSIRAAKAAQVKK